MRQQEVEVVARVSDAGIVEEGSFSLSFADGPMHKQSVLRGCSGERADPDVVQPQLQVRVIKHEIASRRVHGAAEVLDMVGISPRFVKPGFVRLVENGDPIVARCEIMESAFTMQVVSTCRVGVLGST